MLINVEIKFIVPAHAKGINIHSQNINMSRTLPACKQCNWDG
jgi:hypothetical protein